MYAASPAILMVVSPYACWREDGVPGDTAPPGFVPRVGRFRDKLTAREPQGVTLHQNICLQSKQPAQCADHRQGQSAPAVQNLHRPGATTDGGLQVPSLQTILLHHEQDGRDRIRRLDQHVPRLPRRHQCREHIAPIAFRRALDLGERHAMIGCGLDAPLRRASRHIICGSIAS
jgi:hypothetical protein